jgi:FkbM family methyltransferase
MDVRPYNDLTEFNVRIEDLPPIRLTKEVLPDLRLHCESGEHAAEMRAFTQECKPGGFLIDVGAHNGFFTLLFAAADVSNRVLAFEPSDQLRSRAEYLAQINQLDSRVEFSPCVISDKPGEVRFFSDAASGFVQTQAFSGNDTCGFSPVTLRATTVDEACLTRSLVPTLIKIDVEGFEWEVLQGALQTLKKHRPTIFLELHLNYLEQRGLDPRKALELLEQCGYHFFSSAGQGLTLSSIIRSWLPVLRLVARVSD